MNTSNNSRLLIGIIIVLILVNVASLGALWLKPKGKKHGPPLPPDYLEQKLNFTQEQQLSYHQLRKEHRGEMRQVFQKLREQKEKLFKLLTESVDTTEVTAITETIGALEAKRDQLTFHHFQNVKAICNTDQKKLFNLIIEDILHRPPPPPPGRPGPGGPPH